MGKRGRPAGKDYPCDVRVRVSEIMKLDLISVARKRHSSLSDFVRQALMKEVQRVGKGCQ